MRINKKSFLCQTIFYFFILVLFTQCNSKSSLPKGDPNNGGLFLPDGFEAVVVVDSIGSARHLAVNDNGDIYIKLSRSKKGEGNVALRDVDGDGKTDSIVHFGDYDNEGSLSNCMTKVQGKEYAETGITVNALAPAVVRTALVDAMPEEQVKYMTDKIPMKRCGTLEEVANIIAYIVSAQNSFTTGFTFDLSGGRATY